MYVTGVFSSLSNSVVDEEQQLLAVSVLSANAPSKPGHPAATNDRGIYMTVKWREPEDSGGADITGYVIKYGSEGTDVDKYDELSVDKNTTVFQFTNQLKASTRYRFAVAAVNATVNAIRQGEFSEFTGYIETGRGKQCCDYHAINCAKFHDPGCHKI